MRLAGILSALMILVAVPSLPRAARADDDRARFAASFRYAGSSSEQAARRAAIDRGIDTLFFMIRGIARSRLSEGTKIEPWVAFSFDAETIRVRDPSGDDVSPASGAPVEQVSGGDRAKLSQRIAAGTVTQTFVADAGQRRNEWTLSPDSNRLLLKVTVSSPKLSRPVIYTLTYERVR
jgi:hypothetical protein